MLCSKCQDEIPSGEQRDHYGQAVCEDCYMDLLSPAKACDPWAVRSAKSTMELAGGDHLNDLQIRILEILQQTGGITPDDLLARLGVPVGDMEKEVASLRHMEKLGGELREGRKVLVLW